MRKTFISYKYSESRDVRDRILSALGPEYTRFYMGETAESPDLTNFTTETIKNHLKDMIYSTSVTILVISPQMRESNWISWELEYALKNQKRGDIYSHSNGIVGVIANQFDGDAWFKRNEYWIGNTLMQHSCLPDIVVKNRMNKKNIWNYQSRLSVDYDSINSDSYISIVSENAFLRDPQYYIESAYKKSQHLNEYNIIKQSEKDRKERESRGNNLVNNSQQGNLYDKLSHLQLVEQQIQRMANNSFKIKSWSITIIGAAIGYWLKDGYSQKNGIEIAILIVIVSSLFWWLDAYYLTLEKGYRELYAAIDHNKINNYTLDIKPYIKKIDIKYVAITSKVLTRTYVWGIILEIIFFGQYYLKFRG